MGPVAEDSVRMRQPLAPSVAFVDLCLGDRTQEGCLTHLYRWATQRSSLHLGWKKLKIFTAPSRNIEEVLNAGQLDSILEVDVNFARKLPALGTFAPYLGQTSNVQRLLLSHIHVTPSSEEKQRVTRVTSQFPRPRHRRKLSMECPSVLKGRLDQMLRCPKTPLETLPITDCQLTESDLAHLSQCPNVSLRKDLELSGNSLARSSLESPHVLLEKAAPLQDVDSDLRGLTEAHFEATLPTLSHCHQLRTFSVRRDLFSVAIMGRLWGHTARRCHLHLEPSPVPLESGPQGALHLGRSAQVWAELIEILRDLGLPGTIRLNTICKIFCDSELIICPGYTPA